jgi:hypothetical protein
MTPQAPLEAETNSGVHLFSYVPARSTIMSEALPPGASRAGRGAKSSLAAQVTHSLSMASKGNIRRAVLIVRQVDFSSISSTKGSSCIAESVIEPRGCSHRFLR